MLFIATLSCLVIGFTWIKHEQKDFSRQSAKLKSEYLNSQKQLVKNTVENAINFIEYKVALTEKRLRQNIKRRVYEAYGIVDNIYQKNSEKLTDNEIIMLVKQALRPVRFFDNRNYYFIDDLDGNSILYPPKSSFEGKNLMHIMNKEGVKPFPDIIKLVQENTEGYYVYNWVKYTEGSVPTEKEFPKITYFKLFKPFNWFIAVGEYQDYIEDDIKREILERVSKISFKNGEYINIHTYDGIKLVSKGEVLKTPVNEKEATDYKGKKYVKEQTKVAMKDDGGFVYSDVTDYNTGMLRSRISFSKSFPSQGWILTAGNYIDEADQIIEQKKLDLRKHQRDTFFKIIIIILGLWVFTFILARCVSFKAKSSFITFSQFFQTASTKDSKIDPSELHFSEFSDLAYSANKMIEKRNKAEEALRKSEEKYRSIMESMDDAVYICSSDFHIEYMNPVMIERIGYDAAGETCHKVIHDLDEKCKWCAFAKVKRGESESYEIVSPKDNNTYHITNSPIHNPDGSISKLTVFRDITEFRKLEVTLQQAQKMESIGTLAGGIAHDFNNILFPIIGYAEMLIEDSPEDSPSYESLNEIYLSALRARDLVKQILTFSRQDNTDLGPIKIQAIIKEALKLIRSTIPTTIDIKQNIQTDCGVINADPTQIHQIIMNLTTNAYHAMEETGGKLDVSLKEIEIGESDLINPDMKPGFYACLIVADTGKGMDKGLIGKIFDPFFTTKEQGKGTGMGLSVVHGIVNKMGGVIQINSKPDKGTQFHVYFPVIKSRSESQKIYVKEGFMGGTEHILLVDDEQSIITLEKQVLKRLGYHITAFTNSIEALEAFRATPDKFDMVITDMAMPKMSGDELAVELIKIRSDIPVLLCTGFSHTMTEKKAKLLGIKSFIMKPIVSSDFTKRIREELDKQKN